MEYAVEMHGITRIYPENNLRANDAVDLTLRKGEILCLAGENGAGKTTFAREFLPKDAGVVHFVNSDLIAGGLSPLRPELAALAAGRLVLKELDRLAPVIREGGFIPGIDHSVPADVSWDAYRSYLDQLIKTATA